MLVSLGVRSFRRTGVKKDEKGWWWREKRRSVFWSGALSFQTLLRAGFICTILIRVRVKVEGRDGGREGGVLTTVDKCVDTQEFLERRIRSEWWEFYVT